MSEALKSKALSDYHETGDFPDAGTLLKIGLTLLDFIKLIIESSKGRKVKILTDLVMKLTERQEEADKRLDIIETALIGAKLLR